MTRYALQRQIKQTGVKQTHVTAKIDYYFYRINSSLDFGITTNVDYHAAMNDDVQYTVWAQ